MKIHGASGFLNEIKSERQCYNRRVHIEREGENRHSNVENGERSE